MDRERPHPESVTLEISDCSKEDARIVFDTNTEDRRSKVSTPSGLGYTIGWNSDLGRSVSWSAWW